VLDCVIAYGRRVPDARLISRLADDLADRQAAARRLAPAAVVTCWNCLPG
jgi:hypothetical protein